MTDLKVEIELNKRLSIVLTQNNTSYPAVITEKGVYDWKVEVFIGGGAWITKWMSKELIQDQYQSQFRGKNNKWYDYENKKWLCKIAFEYDLSIDTSTF